MPINTKPKYHLDTKSSAFTIENYNFSKPFANFFPGIAGKYGIPMWVFYVNRAQAIASFGTNSKDHAILEFFPANKSWQFTSLQGFRTFIKVSTSPRKRPVFYEPFHNGFANSGFDLSNRMHITSYDLKLEEDNSSLGLNTKVEYFTIPQDYYAALVRTVTITNKSGRAKKIQLIDGLPQIIPFGVANLFLKKLSRTVEAWMNIENLENNVPFYKLDVDPTDRPEVIHIEEGNFYLAFHYKKSKPEIIKPIVDPATIFGPETDFSCPHQFLVKNNFASSKDKLTKNKTPCGMAFVSFELDKHEEKTIYSVIGYMRNKSLLNGSIKRITKAGYLKEKQEENKRIIDELQSDIDTKSNSRHFDLYARSTYLDNIMRGGYPLVFKSETGPSVFYLYSRKHGDLERDYNKFQIQPTYFSQGNGNYRDTNQNRRSDVWFNPDIGDDNVISFLSLIQADGFNPLVIKSTSFILKNIEDFQALLKRIAKGNLEDFISFLKSPFTPGEAIFFIEENKIKLEISYDEFIADLLSHCQKLQDAEHGEGFWTDHWTYNLDLLESYLGIYPEKLREIVFDKICFTFYDNIECVRPRKEKYLLCDGKIKQLHSVTADHAKKEMIKKRAEAPHLVRTQYGQGEIYRTNLMNKLLCLLVNKLASLDPFGIGIEMEANKPNWFDALNGLPGLFGSSINETFELKRLIIFIEECLEKCHIGEIWVSEEILEFLFKLDELIGAGRQDSAAERDFQYWDKSSSLKEAYRAKTKMGFSGQEKKLSTSDLTGFLSRALLKIERGIERALDKKINLYTAYFINEVTQYSTQSAPQVIPTRFSQIRLPLFLEAQVHALRSSLDTEKAKILYTATKKSDLYDKALKMFKTTVNLESMPEEIGRCRVFTPGWLEHESIWLHMEYKFLLELLKSGLYTEFYAEFKNTLIPFQDPQRYGRNILENSSFLVSSAFPDKSLHGNGFVARLSGSTAEFVNMWLIMNAGIKPFLLNNKNEVALRLMPILPSWLFDKKGDYCFNFLSTIKVTYHNPKRKNTFGKNAAKVTRINFLDKNNHPQEIISDTIPSPFAEEIRSRQIRCIDVHFD